MLPHVGYPSGHDEGRRLPHERVQGDFQNRQDANPAQGGECRDCKFAHLRRLAWLPLLRTGAGLFAPLSTSRHRTSRGRASGPYRFAAACLGRASRSSHRRRGPASRREERRRSVSCALVLQGLCWREAVSVKPGEWDRVHPGKRLRRGAVGVGSGRGPVYTCGGPPSFRLARPPGPILSTGHTQRPRRAGVVAAEPLTIASRCLSRVVRLEQASGLLPRALRSGPVC